MANTTDDQPKKVNTNKGIDRSDHLTIREMATATPKLSQLYILRDERAALINSSTIKFGDEVIRLVNIAFQTSKAFPSIMSTCEAVSVYLQEELQQKYSRCHFHIIIAENDGFDFATNNYVHFADISQEQYRVLIFSTKAKEKTEMETHDANGQMKLRWNSVIIKQLRK